MNIDLKTEVQVLQNLMWYLSEQESIDKTMKNFFKEGSKNYNWFDMWEKHHNKCLWTVHQYIEERKKFNELYLDIKWSRDNGNK